MSKHEVIIEDDDEVGAMAFALHLTLKLTDEHPELRNALQRDAPPGRNLDDVLEKCRGLLVKLESLEVDDDGQA